MSLYVDEAEGDACETALAVEPECVTGRNTLVETRPCPAVGGSGTLHLAGVTSAGVVTLVIDDQRLVDAARREGMAVSAPASG